MGVFKSELHFGLVLFQFALSCFLFGNISGDSHEPDKLALFVPYHHAGVGEIAYLSVVFAADAVFHIEVIERRTELLIELFERRAIIRYNMLDEAQEVPFRQESVIAENAAVFQRIAADSVLEILIPRADMAAFERVVPLLQHLLIALPGLFFIRDIPHHAAP